MTDASNDEFIAELEASFGLIGYARYFKLLEAVGTNIKPGDRSASLTLPWSKWQEILGGKRKKLETFLEHLQNKTKIFLVPSENVLKIEIPNLLKYKDEYQKKSRHTPDNVRPKIQRQIQSTDTETDISLPKKEAHSPRASCPFEKIILAYHEEAPKLPSVRLLTDKRKRSLRARWTEDTKRQSEAWWRMYFRVVNETPFLTGSNDRGWRADLEWLANESNMAKVLEGKYERA